MIAYESNIEACDYDVCNCGVCKLLKLVGCISFREKGYTDCCQVSVCLWSEGQCNIVTPKNSNFVLNSKEFIQMSLS